MNNKNLAEIAEIIRKDWKKVNFAAVPYLEAMSDLNSITDNFGADSGREIVLRFICNAQTWRGPVAKEVKKELNRRLK